MKYKIGYLTLALLALIVLGANDAAAQKNRVVTSVKVTDIQFLDMMMPHHADGVKMARMGIEKAQNPGVKALAEKMAAGQEKDIEEMQKMRDDKFSQQPKAEMMTVKGRRITLEMMEKMSREDLQKLEAATGTEFDRVFLDVFTKHHRMAIDMSKEETGKGEEADVKKKAREIISVQTKELGEINRLKRQVSSRNTRAGS